MDARVLKVIVLVAVFDAAFAPAAIKVVTGTTTDNRRHLNTGSLDGSVITLEVNECEPAPLDEVMMISVTVKAVS